MIFKQLLEIAEPLAVIVASAVAIYGIDAWRREARWKRRYELAEEVLALFYQARDVIGAIRSPAAYSSEGKTRKRGENEDAAAAEQLDTLFVPIERYLQHKELFATLRAKCYRCMASFGKGAEEPFRRLFGVTGKIVGAARSLGRHHLRKRDWPNLDQGHANLQHVRENEDVIWWAGENDPIEKEVNDIVLKVETICEPFLSSKTR